MEAKGLMARPVEPVPDTGDSLHDALASAEVSVQVHSCVCTGVEREVVLVEHYDALVNRLLAEVQPE